MDNGEERAAKSGEVASDSDSQNEIDRLQAENEQLKSSLRRRRTWRQVLAGFLVVLTSLSVVAATFAVWAHQALFDTDRFMSTVGPGLDDPAFYNAIGDKVSGEVLDSLDIEDRVTMRLADLDAFISNALVGALDLDAQALRLLSRFDRPSLTALAPSISEGLESRIDRVIHGFFNSDQFRTRFPELIRRGHVAAVAFLRDDLADVPNVYIDGDEVRLNLIPIVADALRGLTEDLRGFLPDIQLPETVSDVVADGRDQLASAIQARLPDDFGQVTLMSAGDLTAVQEAAVKLDRFVWGLVVLALLLLVGTILVSPRRRRTAIQLAIGVAVGITIGALIVRRTEDAIVARVSSPDGARAVRSLVGGILTSLRRIELVVLIVAVVAVVSTHLAGRPAWLERAKENVRNVTDPGPEGSRFDRWIAGHFDLLRVLGVALALLVLFLVGLGWIPAIVIGGLLALYLWVIVQARIRVRGGGDIRETTSATAGTLENRGVD
jgi:hypothetical protein